MNPFSAFFFLAGEQRRVRRCFALYSEIKAPLTELIENVTYLLKGVGALGDGIAAADPLAQYDSFWIQQSINALQQTQMAVDGELGSAATRAAVTEFQKANGLTPDGIAG